VTQSLQTHVQNQATSLWFATFVEIEYSNSVAYEELEQVVFDEMLQHIQARVRALAYVMTVHADEEMDDDGLGIFDIEQVILTGQVIERQRDRQTRDWKYLIHGQTHDALDVIVVTKISPTDTVVIVTVYRQ